MTFSVRHFLRQVRPEILRSHFEYREARIPEPWWQNREPKLATMLADFVMTGTDEVSQTLLADLTRCGPMANERGRTAMINAAANTEEITAMFGSLGNDFERSLWLLTTDETLFRIAEDLRFFDYYAEGNRGRSFEVIANQIVSLDPDDHRRFAEALQAVYRKRDGSGISCHVEVIDRDVDAGVQVSVYIQGLPNNTVEFVQRQFTRSTSHPAIEAAIVYAPKAGQVTTVVKGGQEVHEALLTIFMQFLLKTEPKFVRIIRQRFDLGKLVRDIGLAPIAEMGISAVRVRKLKLCPPAGVGFLTVEAPAGVPNLSVYSMGRSWFSEGSAIFTKFTVTHATIAIHFEREPSATRDKTINLELTLPNSSNLKNLTQRDRQIAEAHLQKWAIVEPKRGG